MTLPFGRQFGLFPRGGAGLVCDEMGVALGSIELAVVMADSDGRRRCRLRPAAEIAKALDLAYGYRLDRPADYYCAGIRRIAELIEDGDRGQADLHAVFLGLPKISSEGMTKLTIMRDLKKSEDGRENEPRIAPGVEGGGEWTVGTGDGDVNPEPAAFQGVTPAEKAAFVRGHLADATKAAQTLGIPVENLLGLAALESAWGRSRFAKEGNNLFNIYFPAPLSTQPLPAIKNKKARVAKFGSFSECFDCFAIKYKSIITNKKDPVEFASILQDRAKFGIDPDNGAKIKEFVPGVVRTIRGMQRIISESTV